MVIVLATPPVTATLIGYFTHNFFYEYVALLGFALLSVGLYFLIINLHGRTLARREIDILDAVREPADE